MKRTLQSDGAPSLLDAFAAYTLRVPAGKLRRTSVGYRLLEPETLARGKKYPLVVFMHGAGERGYCNLKQLKYLPEQMAQPALRKKYLCFVLAPQCPAHHKWIGAAWSAVRSSPLAAEPTLALQLARKALDAVLAEFPIDRRRVYLTGLSMGGFATWEMGLRWPEIFAALAPICGGGDEKRASQLAQIPVWAWHGADDDMVPVVRSRNMIEALRAAGGKPKYSELAGVGHHSWNDAYAESSGLMKWLFRQEKK